MTTIKERQRQLREDAILDAAQQLISARGFHAVTMDDVAAETGISKATLYQHFRSKEEMAIQMLIRRMQCSRAYIETVPREIAADRRLEQVVRWILEQRFGSSRWSMGTAKNAILPLIPSHAGYQEAYRCLIDALSALVDAAKAEGTVDATMPTRFIVQVLFSLLRDAEFEELLASGETSHAQLSDTLVAILFRGIGSKEVRSHD